jgi:RimJ/RimL family protein N-acetyltransferase
MNPQIKHLLLPGTESSRLIMKPFCIKDAEDMFEYTSDPDSCKFLSWGPHTSISEAVEFLEKVEKKNNNPDDINWGMYLKESNKLIGSIRIYEINTQPESVMMSYMLNPTFARKGYMSECITAAVKACTSFLDTKIVRCDIADENTASIRVAEKCGMVSDTSVKPWYFEIKGKRFRVQKYVFYTDTDGRVH